MQTHGNCFRMAMISTSSDEDEGRMPASIKPVNICHQNQNIFALRVIMICACLQILSIVKCLQFQGKKVWCLSWLSKLSIEYGAIQRRMIIYLDFVIVEILFKSDLLSFWSESDWANRAEKWQWQAPMENTLISSDKLKSCLNPYFSHNFYISSCFFYECRKNGSQLEQRSALGNITSC